MTQAGLAQSVGDMLPVNLIDRTIDYFSDHGFIGEKLGWKPARSLGEGMEKTYAWIAGQVGVQRTAGVAR